jgi:hypothetical protein
VYRLDRHIQNFCGFFDTESSEKTQFNRLGFSPVHRAEDIQRLVEVHNVRIIFMPEKQRCLNWKVNRVPPLFR